MLVELTASVCTFCGGAVGTAPGQASETADRTEADRRERTGKGSLAAVHGSWAVTPRTTAGRCVCGSWGWHLAGKEWGDLVFSAQFCKAQRGGRTVSFVASPA